MFRGDHPELGRTMVRAWMLARDLGHPRVGSEHLLLSLASDEGTVATVLTAHGATRIVLGEAVHHAAPTGAGAAADRESLAALGIDLDRLLGPSGARALDRPPSRESLFPLGTARARRHCALANPPIGLDTQAVYAASLRLALARREREHRPEHLALTLVALDPGAAWTLSAANVNRQALLTHLAAAFPPPRRNPLLRAERRIALRHRHDYLIRHYQQTTGRTATDPSALTTLIGA
ncbi:Clp protease N-terminal domain-containing protein [Streptosporangium saharense]|uniref:Clp protease N-terminal domain-containing protein n=1 Tax=Streptosporangium saharense TaxID=1706840 RepID=UPI0033229568